MAKIELGLHALVAPTETVIVSAYDLDGKVYLEHAVTTVKHGVSAYDLDRKADASTLASYIVGGHLQVTGEVKRIVADESILNEKGTLLQDDSWLSLHCNSQQCIIIVKIS